MSHSIRFQTKRLKEGELLFESMRHESWISALDETQLNLVSENRNIAPEDLLGQPVGVSIRLADDAERDVHGYVTRLALGARRGRFHSYQATVKPWLWFLSRRTNCRIFQNQTVPDIVKAVFEAHKIADFKFTLFRQYRERVYCVQYRESDLNFVMRLLENEGIYWYFEHTKEKHTLVLVDSASVHDAEPGCESLPYFERFDSAPPQYDNVYRWTFARHVKTGKVVLKDYDFERPSMEAVVHATQERSYELSDYELFDYQPGWFVNRSDSQQYALDRVDEFQAGFEVHQGRSNSPLLRAGRLLGLTRHPREDQNAEYLLTHATLSASDERYESLPDPANASAAYRFECEFDAIPSSQQFRPRRQTPKPVIQGPQTAKVVGPKGGEIHTDKYGRIKVQFYWDRYGKLDDDSSCWIRVSQSWGGKGWGGMFIPHVGQEVIVEFLEGDPDQPLVTGRVYNAENMPPLELPANKTKSIIRDHGGNQIRMEGAKGSEQIHLFSPFGKTKISIGAPNDGPGFLFQTQEEMRMYITKLVDQRFDANKQEEVKGQEQKKNWGNVKWDFLSNWNFQVVGANDQITKGRKTDVTLGLSTQTVVGLYDENFFGGKISIAAPMQVEYTRGYKINRALAENITITPSDIWKLTKSVVKGEFSYRKLQQEHLEAIASAETVDEKDLKFKVWKARGDKWDSMISGDTDVKVDGKYNLKSQGEINLDCSGGQVSIKSSSEIKLIAPKITASADVKIDKTLDVGNGTLQVK